VFYEYDIVKNDGDDACIRLGMRLFGLEFRMILSILYCIDVKMLGKMKNVVKLCNCLNLHPGSRRNEIWGLHFK